MSQRVLITGAASGLGRELAIHYGSQGCKVCVADIHQQRAEETVAQVIAAGGDAFYCQLDVRQIEDFDCAKQQIIERWQGLDILINNAGVASAGQFSDVPIDTWEWILSINLMGVVKGCKSFTPLFKEQGHGHFINIASMAGLLNPPGMADYNVAKAGVVALSESLRSELAPFNIETTVVCPSFFKTNLAESLRSTDEVSTNAFNYLLEKSDISAADIAAMIAQAAEDKVFLLMPHSRAKTSYEQKLNDPDAAFEEMKKIATSNANKLAKLNKA